MGSHPQGNGHQGQLAAMRNSLPFGGNTALDSLITHPSGDSDADNDRPLIFALTSPDAVQKRTVRISLALLFLVFLALVPFATVELRRYDGFFPAYTSARVVVETITACLLFSLFRTLRTRSVLMLGGGFLFSALMAIGHIYAFTHIHAVVGAADDAGRTTAWIYFMWHGGFSLALLAYGLLDSEPPKVLPQRSRTEIVVAVCVVVAAVVAALYLSSAASGLAAVLEGKQSRSNLVFVAVGTALLNVAAIIAVLRRRPGKVLDLWVLTVACAWLFETGLAALINHGQFDLGWYAGRLYGLLAAAFLLSMLLIEHSRLYRGMLQHQASMQRSSVEQLQVAVTSLSVAQRAASAGFWDWDIRTGALRWSDELFQLFGLDPRADVAEFAVWRKVVHPDDLAQAEARIAEALERKTPLYNRYRIVRATGDVRWIDVHGDVVRDESGAATRMTGLCIDVTDRVAAEEALRESEGKLRLFVEHAPCALVMMDERMRYVAVSWRWLSDYGLDDSIIGRSHYDVFPEIPERWKDVHRRALAGEVVRSEEDRFERLDASVHWLRWEVRPWHRANNSIGGIVAMSEDITARKHVQDALRDSEYFHRQTLESIPGMVFTTRPDGACDYQSQQWVDYTGIPMSEHLGVGWHLLLHPDDRDRAMEAWKAAVQGRGVYDLEYRVRRHDGVHEWFKVIGRPILDAQGRIVRWFGVAVNIERMKQAEAEVAQRSRELEAMIDAMPAMVYTKDAARHYTRVNSATCEFLGLSTAQIIGNGDERFVSPEWARAAAESDSRVLSSKTSIKNVEESWHDSDGRERWVSTSKSPFLDDDGGVAGLVGVSIEITEQKLAEAGRVRALERQRDALVREVHHRIKNHLQGVIGLLRYKGSGDPAISSRLELAIAQIGSIAQVYGLQGRSHDTQLRLHELIESAIQGASAPVAFSFAAQFKDIVLPQADAVPLALVINELITNAIKHLDRTQALRAVRVQLFSGPEGIVVEILGGPARLPPGFDYAQRRGLGTGLELVAVLLPERRCRLTVEQKGDEVVARLILLPDARLNHGGVGNCTGEAAPELPTAS